MMNKIFKTPDTGHWIIDRKIFCHSKNMMDKFKEEYDYCPFCGNEIEIKKEEIFIEN